MTIVKRSKCRFERGWLNWKVVDIMQLYAKKICMSHTMTVRERRLQSLNKRIICNEVTFLCVWILVRARWTLFESMRGIAKRGNLKGCAARWNQRQRGTYGARLVVEATRERRRIGGEKWLNLGGRGHRWREANLGRRTRARKVDPANAPALRYDSQSKQVPSSSPEGRRRIQTRRVPCRNGYAAFSCLLARASGKMDFLGRVRARDGSFFGKSVSFRGVARRRTVDFDERDTPLFPRLSKL